MEHRTDIVDSPAKQARVSAQASSPALPVAVSLFTGCQDRPYAFGLAMSVLPNGTTVDFVGGDEVDSPELHTTPGVRFLNLRGAQRGGVSPVSKIVGLLCYYARILAYSFSAKSRIFHILWNNRFEHFDRTFLTLFFKLLGKKVVLTAHNVNAGRRDQTDSFLNRLTLRIQYHLASHIFVHTQKMKEELLSDFGVRSENVTVITHPVIDAFPDSPLTFEQARERLGLRPEEKAILFFGNIRPYKGLEYLVPALSNLLRNDASYRLIIAGQRKKGSDEYLDGVLHQIRAANLSSSVLLKIGYIPEQEAEIYFKAADVLALPYKEIFQSGVLFVAYRFGLPVVATDVGSFREDILQGQTGFLCKSCDSSDLAAGFVEFFSSDLYSSRATRRHKIRTYAEENHSWESFGRTTHNVYAALLGVNPL
jgi:D-inositol-3-phosphate glycosyltransferase